MNLKNFTKVFNFTIVQLMKTKSYKISTIIIMVMVFIGVSLINIIPAINSNSNKSEKTIKNEVKIKEVYYKNNSNLNFLDSMKAIFPDITFKETKESDKVLNEKIENTENSEVYVEIDKNDNNYTLTLVKPPKKDLVTNKDADIFMSSLNSVLESSKLESLGISPNEIKEIKRPIENKLIVAGEKENSIEEKIAKMILPTVISIILFYIIYFYGYWVASSIVSEKTSRVMELLLTSLKPAELIVGKCVAMGVLALIQFLSIIIISLLSYSVSGILVKKFINSSATTINLSAIFSSVSPLDVLFIILFFILGYTVYALCNSLAGSTISKVEDLNMAMMPVSMLGVVGFYIAIIALSSNAPLMVKLATFIPFASPFYVPAMLVSNNIPISETLASLAIIVVFIVILIIFTQKVYSVAILHNGNRLKFKDLFRIFKEEK
ncbi:ABC transporter permease [Clostridium fallax]|uniref:ABC-2 type transport system permease protein n=1 Tax=Clostridium fallax TaxID=1533 RepID=A0A1M4WF31_9CLOT|nr:ABC transporter permease [Clostridium fallax]SHE79824.1 ABC-2 type transport system permease protein [Clostridium fallax]SQB04938.1 Na+ efflux pump ABC transporter permease [Clostridium fallax]